jgi:hypothetical protein
VAGFSLRGRAQELVHAGIVSFPSQRSVSLTADELVCKLQSTR